MAPIAVGDKIPDAIVTLYSFNMQQVFQVSLHSVVAGKKIILIGAPSAYDYTSCVKQVSGFVEKAEQLKAKGVDYILLISVNSPYEMTEWAKNYPNNKHIKFLADESSKYTRTLGLAVDWSKRGMGIRSRRFALVCDNLEVKIANIEKGENFEISSADDILKALG